MIYMNKILSKSLAILLIPFFAVFFIYHFILNKGRVGVFSTVSADIPFDGSGGSGSGGYTGGSGGVSGTGGSGTDAGGNAAVQGNDSAT